MNSLHRLDTSKNSPLGLNDRIGLMQTFVRIVEAGSLSAAAKRLGTTQPTVSRRLQTLERSLGLRLLSRSTHTMKLTDDGARCYERAKALLADWDAFESDLRGVDAEPEGALRVIVPHAFGQQQLIAPLAAFLYRYPGVSVEWLLHDRPPDFIAEGIDCAIQIGDIADPSVVAIQVAEIRRVVIGAPSLLADGDYPEHASQLAALPWLSLLPFYRNDVRLTHTETGDTHMLSFRPRMATDSLYALRNAALQGLGVCVVSAWVAQAELASGRLLQLAPRWQAAPLPVYLVYPYARFYPVKLRRFIESMRQALPSAFENVG